MSFHAIRFPLDIALGAQGGPERRTDVTTLASGREQRNARWSRSRRRYNAGYGVKSIDDLAVVTAFFEERCGRLHSFLWRDGLDWQSGRPLTAFDQPLGTGDGTTTIFQLVKTYGTGLDTQVRPITKPVAASVVVGVDGVEIETGFAVDALTGVVAFEVAPAEDAVLTAGFVFDVPVRFDTDRLEAVRTGFSAAEIPNIPLIEVFE